MSSSKRIYLYGSLRQMSIRVNRLEIKSVMVVFLTQLR